jgi:hypothetical protein
VRRNSILVITHQTLRRADSKTADTQARLGLVPQLDARDAALVSSGRVCTVSRRPVGVMRMSGFSDGPACMRLEVLMRKSLRLLSLSGLSGPQKHHSGRGSTAHTSGATD